MGHAGRLAPVAAQVVQDARLVATAGVLSDGREPDFWTVRHPRERHLGGDPDELEPELPAEDEPLPPGASISEWDWFELPQIAQLRRDVLVLTRARPPSAERR